MRKKFIFLFLLILPLIIYGQGHYRTPRNLDARSNLDGRVLLRWDEPVNPPDTSVLQYDDGTSAGVDPGSYIHDILSVRFTPERPCTLLKVRLLMGFEVLTYQTRFHIWDDDGTGKPDLSEHLASPIIDTLNGAYTWIEVDFGDSISIGAGEDFHIGYEKIDTLPEHHYCYVDSTPSTPTRSFLGRGGHFTPLDGDLMIRAYVTYAGTSSVRVLKSSPTKEFTPFHKERDLTPTRPLPSHLTDREEILSASPREEIAHYKIYRKSTPEGAFSLLGTSDTLSYLDSSTINDNTYYYYVTAVYSELGERGPSDTVHATPRGDAYVTSLDTLTYDYDSPMGGFSWRPGARFANKFTAETPSRVKKISYYFTNPGNFKPGIFADSSGHPGEALFEYPLVDTARVSDAWKSVNMEDYRIIVDGDFYASCKLNDLRLQLGAQIIRGRNWSWDYSTSTDSWSNLDDTTYYIRTVLKHRTDRAYYSFNPGWNLISIPVLPSDGSAVSDLFPFITSVWGFDPGRGRYYRADSLQPGKGYWALSTLDTSFIISGRPVNSFEISCEPHWNLIGAISSYEAFEFDSLATTPSEALGIPGFYAYNSGEGWSSVDQAASSKGYFIYVSEECILSVND